MRNIPRSRRWIIALLLLTASVVLVVKFLPRERTLLERATKVADVRGWWDKDTWEEDKPYAWLSSDNLLSHEGSPPLYRPFTFDTRTGARTPLTKLHPLVIQGQGFMPYRWELSPNKQWLLWCVGGVNQVFAARWDSSEYQV